MSPLDYERRGIVNGGLLTRAQVADSAVERDVRLYRTVDYSLSVAEAKAGPVGRRPSLARLLRAELARRRAWLDVALAMRGRYLSRKCSVPLDLDIQNARQRIAAEESARWIEAHAPKAKYYRYREDLLRESVKMADPSGLFCEFGVAAGYSLGLISHWVPGSEVHGFDSFAGLPEDWWQNGFAIPKGTFSQRALPIVQSNVHLHRGWFSDTVPEFSARNAGRRVSFVHLDADLYASARAALYGLAEHIMPGTILQFDEFLNYVGWKENDFKAFAEFSRHHNVKWTPVGYSQMQFALRVDAIGNSGQREQVTDAIR